jgi:hypothetical protein
VAGGELTEFMWKKLQELPNTSREMAKDIKERLCYVSLDFEKEPKVGNSFKLPGRIDYL